MFQVLEAIAGRMITGARKVSVTGSCSTYRRYTIVSDQAWR